MDWNDDGLPDIIVGDRNGYVSYFRRTGPGISDLTSEGRIKSGGVDIDVGSNSAPVCVYVQSDGSHQRLDWNEDGLYDLLVGLQGGYPSGANLRVYLNEGSNSSPVFSGYEEIAGTYEYRFTPQVCDLNGNGKKDIIAGNNSGSIMFYENIGTNASPEFAPGVNLQAGGSNIQLSAGTRLWVDDWNGNGLLDLLVSDYNGQVSVFLQSTVGTAPGGAAALQGASLSVAANPCNGTPVLRVSLPQAAAVEIDVYDTAGRMVAGTLPGMLAAGLHEIAVEMDGERTGLYFARCRAGDIVLTERFTLIR